MTMSKCYKSYTDVKKAVGFQEYIIASRFSNKVYGKSGFNDNKQEDPFLRHMVYCYISKRLETSHSVMCARIANYQPLNKYMYDKYQVKEEVYRNVVEIYLKYLDREECLMKLDGQLKEIEDKMRIYVYNAYVE